MYRSLLLWLCLLLTPLGTVMAEDKEPAAKELSGMSIVGNDDAPKALYIVPWKGSEIGVEANLDMMVTESAVPVDRDVFKRQLDFYELSTGK